MSNAVKLGVGSYAFRWSIGKGDRRPESPMRAVEIVDAAAELGLGLVQFADNLPLHELPAHERAELAEHARGLGIEIEVGVQGFSPETVADYIDIARGLDARLLRIALDGVDADRPVSDIAAQFGALLPTCQAANVRLAIENHFLFPSRRLVEIVEAVDSAWLGICLDVANSICAHEWPRETIDLLAPHAINLHLKDYVIEPDPYGVGFRIKGVPLGKGALDIPAVFDALLQHDRHVNVILEHWLPLDGSIDEAARQERIWLAQSADVASRFVSR